MKRVRSTPLFGNEGVHTFLTESRHCMPHIVCLCGSTRFREGFEAANKNETILGHIVLSVGTFPHAETSLSPEEFLGRDVKIGLDELHKRKIDLADEILVINVDGYIGSSTRSEIDYALATGKPVRYAYPEFPDLGSRP